MALADLLDAGAAPQAVFAAIGLTPRQCEVLGLLLKGLANKLSLIHI